MALLLLVLVLLAGGGAGLFVWHFRSMAGKQGAPANAVRSVMQLENFVLNISDQNQNTYLRVGIALGLEKAGKSEGRERGGEDSAALSTPVLRDTILDVLMQVKSEQLSTAEGKAQLKQQLLRAIEKRLPELGVREVYFTEFLVQS